MKNSKACPKCSSTKIVAFQGSRYDDLATDIDFLVKTAHVSRYVCADCGFVETWVANPKDLEAVVKNLPKDVGRPT